MTNNTIAGLRRKLKLFSDSRKSYKALRRHLNKQPVGYPSSLTGVELRLLKDMFTVDETRAALHLTSKHEPFETIYTRARGKGYSEETFRNLLDSMGKKGSIFVKYVDGKPYYALHPIAVGMFEFQAKRMSPNYFLDIHKYFYPWFGLEFFTTKPPQLRVIPVEKSLPPAQGSIATYDHVREIVERTEGEIGIVTAASVKPAKT
jgi:Na+-translocating ferredoxin:NAD+ oxidoreductase subunit B